MRWWLIAISLTAIGIAIAMIGFVYDVIYAGIPYQDPTLEMQTRYHYHADIASNIRLIGSVIALIGVVFSMIIAIWSRSRRSVDASAIPINPKN